MTTVRRKPPARRYAPIRARRRFMVLVVGALMAALLHACSARPVCRTMTVRALESGRSVRPTTTRRAVITDPRPFAALYSRLSGRFGFIQVRVRQDWQRLARIVPRLGPCPDLRRGTVVGLFSVTGQPLDGQWPLCFETIRIRDGAGLVTAHFRGGNYLPDGTTFLELAYVEDLDAVLILDIDGVRFYPE